MSTTAQKMKISKEATLFTINAPADFKKQIGALPAGVKITSTGKQYDQLHWFVISQAQMEKELPKVMGMMRPGVLCWTYYPKGSSKMQTDLTRDKGWDALLGQKEYHWISLISFDDTWSAFAFRLKTEADAKKEAAAKPRPIFDFIDPVKKIIRLPDDLEALLQKNKKAAAFFDALSFTNRKEYVEWIITAKRPETRAERVQGTLDRLNKGWKNPRNL